MVTRHVWVYFYAAWLIVSLPLALEHTPARRINSTESECFIPLMINVVYLQFTNHKLHLLICQQQSLPAHMAHAAISFRFMSRVSHRMQKFHSRPAHLRWVHLNWERDKSVNKVIQFVHSKELFIWTNHLWMTQGNKDYNYITNTVCIGWKYYIWWQSFYNTPTRKKKKKRTDLNLFFFYWTTFAILSMLRPILEILHTTYKWV